MFLTIVSKSFESWRSRLGGGIQIHLDSFDSSPEKASRKDTQRYAKGGPEITGLGAALAALPGDAVFRDLTKKEASVSSILVRTETAYAMREFGSM
jgi:hypothetical protein